jgi:uncharacterized membrane protein YhaH (DUF805 family)
MDFWKLLFVPKGYMGRWRYIKWSFIIMFAFFVATVVGIGVTNMISQNMADTTSLFEQSFTDFGSKNLATSAVTIIVLILFLYISFCLTIKRVNDIFERETSWYSVIFTIGLDILGIVYMPLNIPIVLFLFFYPGKLYYDEVEGAHRPHTFLAKFFKKSQND